MRPEVPILLAVVLAFFAPTTGRSQTDESLDAAELAADAGDVDRARAFLRSWLDSEAAARPDADVGRALFLRARLAESVDSAEVDYLEAALRADEHYAALARLRLAQLRLTGGQPALAVGDLELLRADFPGSPLVPESWLWSGFALEVLGDPAAAFSSEHSAGAKLRKMCGLAPLRPEPMSACMSRMRQRPSTGCAWGISRARTMPRDWLCSCAPADSRRSSCRRIRDPHRGAHAADPAVSRHQVAAH
jgi:hypothetical protein